jgi:carbon monoxide dehydrogenase subunit G
MPGCERLERTGAKQYEGALKVKVGPVQGKFEGSVKLSDLDAPESYSMQVDGKGPSGFVTGAGQVRLEGQGDSTLMHYTGEAQVGGRIASVGQRLLESSAKAITRQSLDSLDNQIQARLQDTPPSNDTNNNDDAAPHTPSSPSQKSALPPHEPPSQTEFAIGVTKQVLDDLVSPERRMLLLAGGLGVLSLILVLKWWTNVLARKVAVEILKNES